MSGLVLKLIAVLAMLTDHIGYLFSRDLPGDSELILRMIGRVAMPIFCFLIAEGLYHTKNVQKYAGRLLLFAVISEVPFDLLLSRGQEVFRFSDQNVYFTLFLGLMCILLFDRFAYLNRKLPALLSLLAAAALAQLIQSDYGAFGVLFVFVFYFSRGSKRAQALWFSLAVFLLALYQYTDILSYATPDRAAQWALVSLCELFALIPILTYSGRRGYTNRALQWGFYAFYPVHLLLLTGVYLLTR